MIQKALWQMGLLLLMLGFSAQAQTDSESIRAVIRDETEAFYARDKARWAAAWAHKPYVSLTASLNNGGYLMLESWEKIEKQFASFFRCPPTTEPLLIQYSNYTLHQNGSMAFVHYDQTLTDDRGKTMSHESRVLERLSGQWKIINVVAINNLKEFTLAQSVRRR